VRRDLAAVNRGVEQFDLPCGDHDVSVGDDLESFVGSVTCEPDDERFQEAAGSGSDAGSRNGRRSDLGGRRGHWDSDGFDRYDVDTGIKLEHGPEASQALPHRQPFGAPLPQADDDDGGEPALDVETKDVP